MTREWPQYTGSKKSVRRAGEVLRSPSASVEQKSEARELAKAWRSAHQYPMNTWQVRVRNYTRGDGDALVAQRLKRLPSIERKLARFENSQLDTMQDLGGVRAVLADVDQVRAVEKLLLSRPGNHVLKQHDDYLSMPKDDGYRSVHIAYAYGTRQPTPWDSYRIEIQLRTRLQHFWATAVETVDLFSGQNLKFGTGENWWREFFALMSSEIAELEGMPLVPGTPTAREERRQRLEDIDAVQEVTARLASFKQVIQRSTAEDGKYILLDLDLDDGTLEMVGYSDDEAATNAYADLETRTRSNPFRDVVLVSVDDASKLQQAYPNYFVNIEVFIHLVNRAIAVG
ncbi:RelA/SpoT domain-containing protein [Microbacterium maritypicum]|uniref:RelA/SpoT domain-containing protein n=1 Tax=Microbacterium maritypicum TaxID=33918 RepID=A0ACD4B768_MICMQ|nr:RelA/SpoT domain-containing protein [Microbacterium liquefaciens]UTT53595.1 RelA/SpoT domain-containing protein [Microbacterium liquefaciens]